MLTYQRIRDAWRWSIVPLGLSLGAAAAQVQDARPDATTIVESATPAGHTAGIDRPLSLTLRVARSRTGAAGREQLDYEVQIAPTAPARTATKYSYELASAQGTIVAAGASPTVVSAVDGGPHRGTITTPASLPDGYYLLRVVAAGSNASSTNANMEQQYLRVAQGRITTLDADEWVARSGANQARVIRISFQPRTEEEARARYAAKEATP